MPFLVVIILAVAASGAGREGIHNGAFEGGLHFDGTRPRHWNVGFPGDGDEFIGDRGHCLILAIDPLARYPRFGTVGKRGERWLEWRD